MAQKAYGFIGLGTIPNTKQSVPVWVLTGFACYPAIPLSRIAFVSG